MILPLPILISNCVLLRVAMTRQSRYLSSGHNNFFEILKCRGLEE